MVNSLNISDKDFAKKFNAFLRLRETNDKDVSVTVENIIEDVRTKGDAAIIAYTEKFDRLKITAGKMKITPAEISKARKSCDKEVIRALEHAAERIRNYHQKQLPKDVQYKDSDGITLGWRWNAIDAVGLYVPGGTAAYPSSVLMNAIPAQVAGVKRLAMVVPMPDGNINPAVLAAADIAGITEIYPIGGAQAIAALAYGTKKIAAVDKIVGPGNIYVAEAKRQVFGQVGIDMIAGPSEILVVADNKNKPEWIAADLLSQAEHDKLAQAILITDDEIFAKRVENAVEQLLKKLKRKTIAKAAWKNYGAIIIVRELGNAFELINRIAPEHLELAVEKPEELMKNIRHAGAIFLGRHTPEAIGDYIAGPSHVLPTSHTARFSSGLSVFDFIKRTSIMGCNEKSILAIGEDAALLAETEGLTAHQLSIKLRL